MFHIHVQYYTEFDLEVLEAKLLATNPSLTALLLGGYMLHLQGNKIHGRSYKRERERGGGVVPAVGMASRAGT